MMRFYTNMLASSTKTYHIRWGLMTIGVLITCIAIASLLIPSITQDEIREGPFVMLACTAPEEEVTITESMDANGEVTILPSVHEDATLWLRIDDSYSFSWECEGDFEPIGLSGTNRDYVSSALENNSGQSEQAIFRLKAGPNPLYSTIKIKSTRPSVTNDGICYIRMPWIAQWISGATGEYLAEHQDIALSDSTVIGTTIDGEQLYVPIIDYNASLFDLSMVSERHVLRSDSQISEVIGAYFIWEGSMFFSPSVQYDELETMGSNIGRSIALGMIGVGLSLLYVGLKDAFELVFLLRRKSSDELNVKA